MGGRNGFNVVGRRAIQGRPNRRYTKDMTTLQCGSNRGEKQAMRNRSKPGETTVINAVLEGMGETKWGPGEKEDILLSYEGPEERVHAMTFW